MNEFKDSKPEV